MTTPAAAALYEAQHLLKYDGLPVAVFNPHAKPIAELPCIFGFNNGGSPGWMSAVAIAQDGTVLGGHICSSEGYMPHDLGILEGTRSDRHAESYQKHYPDGYRMEFVPTGLLDDHAGFCAAIELGKAKAAQQPTPGST